MFFACIVIAGVAMAGGIGGATFLVPFLLLIVKVPVSSAVAIGIFIEIFGFAAGVYNYRQKKSIDYSLAKKIITSSTLFVILGVVLNQTLKPTVVEYVFIFALMVFATQIAFAKKNISDKAKKFDRVSVVISAFGGLLLGLISSGMGESNEYNLFGRLKKKPSIAAGTSVLTVAVNALVATVTQTFFFLQKSAFGEIKPYAMLIIYSILGSFVGAHLGAISATKVKREPFRKFISALLYLVAGASLIKVLFIPG